MPPRPRPPCVVCDQLTPKYACTSCRAYYCSVACCKAHKETCAPEPASASGAAASVPLDEAPPDSAPSDSVRPPDPEPPQLEDPPALLPLTSLKWPYVPDTSAYPNPLTRDDPKPLQMHQYEAIATSPAIRTLLSNPRLRTLLVDIDALRGEEREEALQRALGVDSRLLKNTETGTALDEDTKTLRAFAEAIEAAVRGRREDALGLDWD